MAAHRRGSCGKSNSRLAHPVNSGKGRPRHDGRRCQLGGIPYAYNTTG